MGCVRYWLLVLFLVLSLVLRPLVMLYAPQLGFVGFICLPRAILCISSQAPRNVGIKAEKD
jgi:hypothetical protein